MMLLTPRRIGPLISAVIGFATIFVRQTACNNDLERLFKQLVESQTPGVPEPSLSSGRGSALASTAKSIPDFLVNAAEAESTAHYVQKLASRIETDSVAGLIGKALETAQRTTQNEGNYIGPLGLACDPSESRLCFERTTSTTTTTPLGPLEKKIRAKREAEREEQLHRAKQREAKRKRNPFEDPPPPTHQPLPTTLPDEGTLKDSSRPPRSVVYGYEDLVKQGLSILNGETSSKVEEGEAQGNVVRTKGERAAWQDTILRGRRQRGIGY